MSSFSTIARSLFVTTLAVAPIAACGGNISSTSTTTTGDAAFAAVVRDICTANQRCASTDFALLYSSIDDCVARSTAGYDAGLHAIGVAATSDQLATCAHELVTHGCAAWLGLDPTSTCKLSKGTLANGTPCGSPEQCASGVCAYAASTTNGCGACSAPSTQGGQTACSSVGDCTTGEVCFSGRCTTLSAVGGSCAVDSDTCVYGAHCDSTTARCIADAPLGATCATDFDCGRSRKDVRCSSAHVCVSPTLTALDVGAACAFGIQQLSDGSEQFCKPGLVCVNATGPASSAPGTCQRALAEGAACTVNAGVACDRQLSCIGGKCSSPALCGPAGA
jgi:hypothetical protein